MLSWMQYMMIKSIHKFQNKSIILYCEKAINRIF